MFLTNWLLLQGGEEPVPPIDITFTAVNANQTWVAPANTTVTLQVVGSKGGNRGNAGGAGGYITIDVVVVKDVIYEIKTSSQGSGTSNRNGAGAGGAS